MKKSRAESVRHFIKIHGFKQSWIANSIGLDEALFRYFADRNFEGAKGEAAYQQFKLLMAAHVEAVKEDLRAL